LKDLCDAALGPSTEAIIKEAETKGALDLRRHSFMIQLGYGVSQKRMQATMSLKPAFWV